MARTSSKRKAAEPPRIRRARTRRILNLIPSTGTGTDWSVDVAVAVGALTSKPLPKQVDLRANDWWPIGDQGQTGSCVGWAVADGAMRYLLVQANRLGQKERLSVRHVWMASKETDEFVDRPESFIEDAGTSLKAAVDVCRKHGVVPDPVLPFRLGNLFVTGTTDVFYALAAQRKAASYFNAKLDFKEWRRALASGAPIVAGLNVHAEFTGLGADGVLNAAPPGSSQGGHAVCIVGYRSDGHFILRNSWGTGWGANGFAYVSEAYLAARFFRESYVLTL